MRALISCRFLVVGLVLSISFTGWANALPADWECAQTAYFTPRLVPAGENSILDAVRLPKTETKQDTSSYKFNMVRINPGQFTMGSPSVEPKRERFEGPPQTVKIDYAFELGKYEVTFDDWDTCLAGGGCQGYRPDDAGWGRGLRPVINVSWEDAQSYIQWMNNATGLEFRLPSEAEWEYAARAGTQSPYYTGKGLSSKQANFNGQFPYMTSAKGPYRRETIPVGSFKPNPFGLHDVLGNVFEWTADCWNESHRGAPNTGEARRDGDCNYRLMKGGSWVNHGYQIRAAKRTRYTTDFRYDDYGFRIARTLP